MLLFGSGSAGLGFAIYVTGCIHHVKDPSLGDSSNVGGILCAAKGSGLPDPDRRVQSRKSLRNPSFAEVAEACRLPRPADRGRLHRGAATARSGSCRMGLVVLQGVLPKLFGVVSRRVGRRNFTSSRPQNRA